MTLIRLLNGGVRFSRRRIDLFGVIDIVAVSEVHGHSRIVGIQCTSGTGSSRMKKAESEPRLLDWLKAGGIFEVWGWRKVKAGWKAKVRRAEMTESVIARREIQ